MASSTPGYACSTSATSAVLTFSPARCQQARAEGVECGSAHPNCNARPSLTPPPPGPLSHPATETCRPHGRRSDSGRSARHAAGRPTGRTRRPGPARGAPPWRWSPQGCPGTLTGGEGGGRGDKEARSPVLPPPATRVRLTGKSSHPRGVARVDGRQQLARHARAALDAQPRGGVADQLACARMCTPACSAPTPSPTPTHPPFRPATCRTGDGVVLCDDKQPEAARQGAVPPHRAPVGGRGAHVDQGGGALCRGVELDHAADAQPRLQR
jgi:hypothetical protein